MVGGVLSISRSDYQIGMVQVRTGDDIVDQPIQADRLKIHVQLAALQPGGIEQVFNQLLQAIGFLVDNIQKFLLGVLIPGGIGAQQGGGIAFNKTERSAQLVRDGGDKTSCRRAC